MRVDRLLNAAQALLLAEVVRPQQREVVVGVDVVEGEDEVDERAARGGLRERADRGPGQLRGGAGDGDLGVQGAGQLFVEAGEFACKRERGAKSEDG